MVFPVIKLASLFLGILFISGCAYMNNRVDDFKDIFTLAVETKGVNAEIQVLPMTLGIGYADGNGYGLRSGTLGEYEYSEYGVLLVGRKTFKGTPGRGKNACDIMYAIPYSSSPMSEENKPGARVRSLGYSSPACWMNVEAAIHLGVGIRVGMNFAGLLDFLLGFGGVHIFKDDGLN
jgi:hypothetical protein